MTDATARYVISADDRTKSAISSIKRGFTDLDSSAKTVGRTLKGLTTGAAFYGLARGVQALFRNAAESSGQFNDALTRVKKSFHDLLTPKSGIPAATKALDDLNKTLADPQVKAGADQLFSFLIKSAAALADLTAKTVSNLVTIGKGVGLIKGGRQDEIDRLIVEIAKRREGKSALSRGFEKAFGGVGGEDEAAVLESLEKRLYDLQQAQRVADTRQGRIAAGVRGGRDRGAGFDIKPVTETPLGPLNLSLNARAAELTSGLKMEDFGDDLIESTAGIADQMSEIFKESFEQMSAYAADFARSIDGNIKQALLNMEGGFRGFAKSAIDSLRDVLAEIMSVKLRMAVFGNVDSSGNLSGGLLSTAINGLFGMFGGSGAGPTTLPGGGISNFSGPRADGGPVDMGRSYLVGERGPELFTPGRSGMITPNGAGKSVVIHSAPVINVNASQLTQDQAARMVADSQRMMWDELDRRYGLA